MSLFITSLNSGSNGNCYYVGNAEEAVLIDVGISCREVERRMRRLGLTMSTVKAIFISHEHTDHISGVPVLAKKYGLPVYITGPTLHHSRMQLQGISFSAQQPVAIGQLQVTAFVKHHDASDPHSFMVTGNGVSIGVFTDIGQCCDRLVHHFRQCHAAFLEANYDTDMLEKGRYPIFLKNRIRGGQGHLSNQQALDLFRQHRPDGMQVLLLSHLSRDNNDPALVQEIFSRHAGPVQVAVASRYEASKVYEVFPGQLTAAPLPVLPAAKKKRSAIPPAVQSSLF